MTQAKTTTRRPRRMARPAETADTKTAAAEDTDASTPPPEVEPASPEKRPTKIRQVIELLRRDLGATLEELTSATGWQPHSTRAALTGLRKKGCVIEKSKREDATCYRLMESA